MWAEYGNSQVSALIRSRNDTDREGSNKAGERKKHTQEEKKKIWKADIERTKEEKANKKNRKIERKVGRDSVVGIATR